VPLRLRASLAAALALTAMATLAPAVVEAQPPNLILIVADDLGYGDLGSYGQTRIATPTLDRLASEGARLTAAYASAPVCAPSRCSILTGLHAGHCAVRGNSEPNTPLSPDDATVAEVLAAAGYRTGVVGKWALGGELRDGTPFTTWSAPWNVGFHHVLVTLDQELAQDHYPAWLWRDQGRGSGVREAIAENAGDARAVFDDDRFLDAALAFVDDAVADGQPFFLYVALTLPHRELSPPSLGAYAREPWPETERAYAAMVTRIDEDVARITERLREREILDRTIVVFTSDNGPTSIDGHDEAFFESSGGLRGQKRDLYEGGTRVPLIVWGSGIAGASIDAPVSLTDLMPTLADLAGARRPSGIDGASIADGLRLGRLAPPHAAIYTAVERGVGSEVSTRYAIRAGDRKLVERTDGTDELYDLSTDPLEAHDIAAEHRTEVDALRARIAVESRPRPPARDPSLRILADDVRDRMPARERRHVPVLHLVLDGERARAARIESELSIPALTATRHEGATPYVTVPAHPALSVGDESFTIEAFVRLDDAAAPAREWLVLSKQTGRTDAFIDFGVLVRAGDLAHGERMFGSAPERTGRELALVFGDPRLGHREPWGVVSSLAVDDAEVHRITVRFDAPRDRVRFSIDDRTETIEILDRGHVAGDAPLVLGAHHDEHGTFDQALRGELLELRMSRGLVPIGDRLERGETGDTGATVTIDLGRVAAGTDAVERRLRIESAGEGRLRGVDVTIDTDGISDERLSIAGPTTATLFSRGDRSEPLTLRLDPTHGGPIDATFVVRGTVRRRGWAAARSPLRVRVIGTVASEAVPVASSGWGAVAVLALMLFAPIVILVALRQRRKA
jgi:arylsulfatase A